MLKHFCFFSSSSSTIRRHLHHPYVLLKCRFCTAPFFVFHFGHSRPRRSCACLCASAPAFLCSCLEQTLSHHVQPPCDNRPEGLLSRGARITGQNFGRCGWLLRRPVSGLAALLGSMRRHIASDVWRRWASLTSLRHDAQFFEALRRALRP